jgi:hypothetical protein
MHRHSFTSQKTRNLTTWLYVGGNILNFFSPNPCLDIIHFSLYSLFLVFCIVVIVTLVVMIFAACFTTVVSDIPIAFFYPLVVILRPSK